MSGSFEGRVEAAATAAWSGFKNVSSLVLGEIAYETLRVLYFRLRKRLFQHSKRVSFTKDECGVLLDLLASRAMAPRGRRQPAQVLNRQLKEALAGVPGFEFACLQEAAKKCAAIAGAAGARED
jgi:hypothetical protein